MTRITPINLEPTAATGTTDPIVFVDARRIPVAGTNLVDVTLTALQTLTDDGVLKLLALERPEVLVERLINRGFTVNLRQAQKDHWNIEVSGASAPEIADLRDLEAPEPMHRVLLAASRLTGNETYFARLPHVPHPLFPLLQERGLQWWVHEEVDDGALLAIRAS